MIQNTLKSLGLDEKEAKTYLKLLKTGSNRASTLAYQIGLPRTTVQNILLRLEGEELVTKSTNKNVHIFTATHPENLLKILQIKKKQATGKYDKMMEGLKQVMPEMVGMIESNKAIPNVKFFQGKDAARKILYDTLTSKTELKDFANIDAMFEQIKDINDDYVKEREKTNLTKRSLLLDTPFARKVYEKGKYSPKSHKGYKWIKQSLYPFALEMNIYDGKISYLTYIEDNFVGVIIENDYIYQMHESMWNLIWDLLPTPKAK